DMVANGAALRSSVAGVVTDTARKDISGQRSYLLHCERSSGQYLWNTLLDAGNEYRIAPAGFSEGQPLTTTTTAAGPKSGPATVVCAVAGQRELVFDVGYRKVSVPARILRTDDAAILIVDFQCLDRTENRLGSCGDLGFPAALSNQVGDFCAGFLFHRQHTILQTMARCINGLLQRGVLQCPWDHHGSQNIWNLVTTRGTNAQHNPPLVIQDH